MESRIAIHHIDPTIFPWGYPTKSAVTGVNCHKYVCHDKTYLLSRQKYAYGDKTFVATNYFCTNTCLSQQNTSFVRYVCRHKCFVPTTTCCRKKHNIVAARIRLSRQRYLWQLPTKILVAAPDKDTCGSSRQRYLWQLSPMIVSKHPSFLALQRLVRPTLRVV